MAMPAPIPTTPADDERLYAANAAAERWYRAQLPRNLGPVAYLRDRGLEAVAERDWPWRVGFAPPTWTGLGDHLRRLGFTDQELLRAGLAFRSREGRVLDLFRDRITFPIRDHDGRTVGFTARVWHPSTRDPQTPKYINSPDTPIYHKGELLFGLHEQRDRTAAGFPPVIVEGPTDTLAIWSAYSSARTGLVALAPCGTALTTNQLDIAANLPGARRHGLAIAFDGDPAGHQAARRAHEMITAHHSSLVARAVRFSANADPGELGRTPAGRAQLRATIRHAPPLLHLILDDRLDTALTRWPQLLHEIEGRIALARALAPLIAEQPPVAAIAAVRHLTETLTHRLGNAGHDADVADTIRAVTFAVAEHLETTPARTTAAQRPPPLHLVGSAFPNPPLHQPQSSPAAMQPTTGGSKPIVAVRRRGR